MIYFQRSLRNFFFFLTQLITLHSSSFNWNRGSRDKVSENQKPREDVLIRELSEEKERSSIQRELLINGMSGQWMNDSKDEWMALLLILWILLLFCFSFSWSDDDHETTITSKKGIEKNTGNYYHLNWWSSSSSSSFDSQESCCSFVIRFSPEEILLENVHVSLQSQKIWPREEDTLFLLGFKRTGAAIRWKDRRNRRIEIRKIKGGKQPSSTMYVLWMKRVVCSCLRHLFVLSLNEGFSSSGQLICDSPCRCRCTDRVQGIMVKGLSDSRPSEGMLVIPLRGRPFLCLQKKSFSLEMSVVVVSP